MGMGTRRGFLVNIRFAEHPDNLSNAFGLDDMVFWGALPMMVDADDAIIADYARRLWLRDLPKCIDVRQRFEHEFPLVRSADQKERAERGAKISLHCNNVVTAVEEWTGGRSEPAFPTFIDQDRRTPYKKFQDSQSLLNQILIRSGDDHVDMADISPVVASAETFEVCRVYISEGDTEARDMIENKIRTECRARGVV